MPVVQGTQIRNETEENIEFRSMKKKKEEKIRRLVARARALARGCSLPSLSERTGNRRWTRGTRRIGRCGRIARVILAFRAAGMEGEKKRPPARSFALRNVLASTLRGYVPFGDIGDNAEWIIASSGYARWWRRRAVGNSRKQNAAMHDNQFRTQRANKRDAGVSRKRDERG